MKACYLNRSDARLRLGLMVSVACFALTSHGAAHAQDASKESPSGVDVGAADSQSENQEILVTARKRSEKSKFCAIHAIESR